MSDTVYYEKPVLLDRQKHRKRRVRPSTSFAFARKANSLYLAGVEFAEASKEYAIVFTRSGNGRIVPVVMLGLRARENLFVDDKNHWAGRYVPAFVRRYPFVLARLPGQQNMGLCIDEAFPGWNESEGEALFDAQGQDTPFLRNAAEFDPFAESPARGRRDLLNVYASLGSRHRALRRDLEHDAIARQARRDVEAARGVLEGRRALHDAAPARGGRDDRAAHRRRLPGRDVCRAAVEGLHLARRPVGRGAARFGGGVRTQLTL